MVYFEVFSSCSIQHLIELAESNQVTHTAKTPFYCKSLKTMTRKLR